MDSGKIHIQLGADRPEFPRMGKVEQRFDSPRLVDSATRIRNSVRNFLENGGNRMHPGSRIAITAGSRGIVGLPGMLRAVAEELRRFGADPFIIPAMGSHGGAREEGQEELLRGYGITPEETGMPIVASMDTVHIGDMSDGTRLYMDSAAYHADGIVVVNKVKHHADFKADIESGLCKMLVIGLGKHKGAAEFRYGWNPGTGQDSTHRCQ
jgi:hypothetical protein